jgi:hypothetical protein
MCNLYSLTKGQQAIRQFTRAARDSTGNLPALPGIFPDFLTPVVFNAALGHAGAAAIRRRADHQYPQYRQSALAALAAPGLALPGAGDVVLRICRHPAAQDANLVRAG